MSLKRSNLLIYVFAELHTIRKACKALPTHLAFQSTIKIDLFTQIP